MSPTRKDISKASHSSSLLWGVPSSSPPALQESCSPPVYSPSGQGGKELVIKVYSQARDRRQRIGEQPQVRSWGAADAHRGRSCPKQAPGETVIPTVLWLVGKERVKRFLPTYFCLFPITDTLISSPSTFVTLLGLGVNHTHHMLLASL